MVTTRSGLNTKGKSKPKKVGKKGCHTVYAAKGAKGKMRYYYIKYTRVAGKRKCSPQPNYRSKVVRLKKGDF
jgi:hypothetical protein